MGFFPHRLATRLRQQHTNGALSLASMRLPDRLSARIIVEIGIAFVGVVLFGSALLANQRWLDHHFLPSFYTSRSRYVWIESIVRIAIDAVGALLAILVRRPRGNLVRYLATRAL